eukprot:TRINITY_DN24048_c0_g1_i3.p1 TRINITY_DN24048_c0_g1~~TRINITY_DN24048_c0_g1_i3.p1  ORF type:complete len:1653 (+),score=354.87 TRINITY_DN24048_c0_g1_i3:87-4961(+)
MAAGQPQPTLFTTGSKEVRTSSSTWFQQSSSAREVSRSPGEDLTSQASTADPEFSDSPGGSPPRGGHPSPLAATQPASPPRAGRRPSPPRGSPPPGASESELREALRDVREREHKHALHLQEQRDNLRKLDKEHTAQRDLLQQTRNELAAERKRAEASAAEAEELRAALRKAEDRAREAAASGAADAAGLQRLRDELAQAREAAASGAADAAELQRLRDELAQAREAAASEGANAAELHRLRDELAQAREAAASEGANAAELHRLRDELAQAREAAASGAADAAELQRLRDELAQARDNAAEQLRQSAAERALLQEQLAQEQRACCELRAERELLRHERDEAAGRAQAVRDAETGALRLQLAASSDRVIQLRSELGAARGDAAAAVHHHKAEATRMREQAEAALGKASAASGAAEHAEGEVRRLRAREEALVEENAKLAAECHQLRSAQRQRPDRPAAEEQVRALQKRLQDAERARAQGDDELLRAQRSAGQLSAKVASLEAVLEEREVDLDQARCREAASLAKLSSAEQEVASAQSRAAAAEAAVQQAQCSEEAMEQAAALDILRQQRAASDSRYRRCLLEHAKLRELALRLREAAPQLAAQEPAVAQLIAAAEASDGSGTPQQESIGPQGPAGAPEDPRLSEVQEQLLDAQGQLITLEERCSELEDELEASQMAVERAENECAELRRAASSAQAASDPAAKAERPPPSEVDSTTEDAGSDVAQLTETVALLRLQLEQLNRRADELGPYEGRYKALLKALRDAGVADAEEAAAKGRLGAVLQQKYGSQELLSEAESRARVLEATVEALSADHVRLEREARAARWELSRSQGGQRRSVETWADLNASRSPRPHRNLSPAGRRAWPSPAPTVPTMHTDTDGPLSERRAQLHSRVQQLLSAAQSTGRSASAPVGCSSVAGHARSVVSELLRSNADLDCRMAATRRRLEATDAQSGHSPPRSAVDAAAAAGAVRAGGTTPPDAQVFPISTSVILSGSAAITPTRSAPPAEAAPTEPAPPAAARSQRIIQQQQLQRSFEVSRPSTQSGSEAQDARLTPAAHDSGPPQGVGSGGRSTAPPAPMPPHALASDSGRGSAPQRQEQHSRCSTRTGRPEAAFCSSSGSVPPADQQAPQEQAAGCTSVSATADRSARDAQSIGVASSPGLPAGSPAAAPDAPAATGAGAWVSGPPLLSPALSCGAGLLGIGACTSTSLASQPPPIRPSNMIAPPGAFSPGIMSACCSAQCRAASVATPGSCCQQPPPLGRSQQPCPPGGSTFLSPVVGIGTGATPLQLRLQEREAAEGVLSEAVMSPMSSIPPRRPKKQNAPVTSVAPPVQPAAVASPELVIAAADSLPREESELGRPLDFSTTWNSRDAGATWSSRDAAATWNSKEAAAAGEGPAAAAAASAASAAGDTGDGGDAQIARLEAELAAMPCSSGGGAAGGTQILHPRFSAPGAEAAPAVPAGAQGNSQPRGTDAAAPCGDGADRQRLQAAAQQLLTPPSSEPRTVAAMLQRKAQAAAAAAAALATQSGPPAASPGRAPASSPSSNHSHGRSSPAAWQIPPHRRGSGTAAAPRPHTLAGRAAARAAASQLSASSPSSAPSAPGQITPQSQPRSAQGVCPAPPSRRT